MLIMSNNSLIPLIKKIKEKKELSSLSDDLVKESIEKYVSKDKINIDKINNSDSKIIVSEVRSELRKLTGRFQRDATVGDFEELLKKHSSTAERIEFYPQLKEIIKELKVKSILDLGCGINPIAIAEKGMEYTAVDINESNLEVVKRFFQEKNISGKVINYDLRKTSLPFPKVDLCIMFKVLDIIETKGHKLAESIINQTNSKYLLISFPTKTLSGKPMNHPQRGWIERLLSRLKYDFKIISYKNEIFYLANKLT